MMARYRITGSSSVGNSWAGVPLLLSATSPLWYRFSVRRRDEGDVVCVDGVTTTFTQRGPANDPEAVVFLHGNPGESRDWTQMMNGLDLSVRAVALDMPGFGGADRPRKFDYSLHGYARYLAGCLDALGIRTAHVVAHDLGGPLCFEWARTHRQSLASLVLINSGILPGFQWHRVARLWQTPFVAEASMALLCRWAFDRLLNAGNPHPFSTAFLKRVYGTIDGGNKRAVRALYRSMRPIAEIFAGMANDLRGIPIPVLVIWGREDPYLPAHYAARQSEIFPNARVHLLDGCGHWPFIDDPDRVLNLVAPFVLSQIGR